MALTIREEISTLRNSLKKVTDDSKTFVDSYIYSVWKKNRAALLEPGKFQLYNTSRFCIKLEVTKSHNCACIAHGCNVLKTTVTVPEFLQGRDGSGFKVRTLGGDLIGKTTEEALKSELTDPIKQNALRWTFNSGKLVIWRNLELKGIELEGVWADPLEWEDKRYCPDGDCANPLDTLSGLTTGQSKKVHDMCMKDFGFPLRLKDDVTADRNPEI